jgi:hypothetical protein
MRRKDRPLTDEELDADKPSSLLSALTEEGAERLVPSDRDWSAIEEKLLARLDGDEEDLTEEELDADAPSPLLASITKESAERLVPADRDGSAIEQKLLARIDAEIESDAPNEALAELTRESKTHLVPVTPNWSAIEKKIHRRVARSSEKKVSPLPVRWRGIIAVSAIAAAAAAVVFAGRSQTTWTDPAVHASRTAGTLGSHEGMVRIGGTSAAAGQAAQAGDRIEVGSGRATFDQTGRVTWALEPQSRVRVTRTEGGLVLALEQGATEAQVVPVPSGEAFAVDITDSSGHVARVAVHGTHLRVARTGDHVVVDLTEGVVTVGRAPRAGSTYGTLVTAPAHVEFDVADVDAVHVDHQATAVRPAVVLAMADKPAAAPQPLAVAPAPLPFDTEFEPPRPEPHVINAPAVSIHRPDNTPAPAPVVQPDALDQIKTAVETCFAQGASQLPKDAPEVQISVSTDLTIFVGNDGKAHTLKFSTPLSKSEQDCIAKTGWAVRFPQTDQKIQLHFDLTR